MRAMPPLYVLVWWSAKEQRHTVTIHDLPDDACSEYEESGPAMDVIAAAKVMEVRTGGASHMAWAPFDIAALHRWWIEDKIDERDERDRTRAQLRREQMP